MDLYERVTTRTAELRGEYAAGEARLAKLEAEEARLRETLLRIDGALLVLNELVSAAAPDARDVGSGNGAMPSEATAVVGSANAR